MKDRSMGFYVEFELCGDQSTQKPFSATLATLIAEPETPGLRTLCGRLRSREALY